MNWLHQISIPNVCKHKKRKRMAVRIEKDGDCTKRLNRAASTVLICSNQLQPNGPLNSLEYEWL